MWFYLLRIFRGDGFLFPDFICLILLIRLKDVLRSHAYGLRVLFCALGKSEAIIGQRLYDLGFRFRFISVFNCAVADFYCAQLFQVKSGIYWA